MKKCTIITYIEKGHDILLKNIDKNSFIICADIGIKYALDAKVIPDLVIADFDSYKNEIPEEIKVIKVPSIKDDSDTGLCIKYAVENGFDSIEIIGGLGGRLDHTLANLQNMKGAKENGIDICLKALGNEVYILKNETKVFEKSSSYISILADGTASGVSLKGTFYTLENAVLSSSFPLGLSNEFKEDKAKITVKDGTLYVVLSDE